MTIRYPLLFREGRIAKLKLRNRLIMCPMADGLAHPDGSASDAQVAYFGARADGGVGLIILGSATVAYPRGAFAPNMTAMSDGRYLEGLKRIVRRVHDGGAAIAAQLVHDGQYSLEDVAAGRPLLVPSQPEPLNPDHLAQMATPEERSALAEPMQRPGARLEYREATEEDLEWVIGRFVAAADLAAAAGFDAVEIHAGHGYLIDSFISPARNRRCDRWGGSIDGRSRLLVEIVRRIRERLPSYPLWCRLNAFEAFVSGGEKLEDAIAVAQRGVAAGLNAVHVTANANHNLGIAATEGHTPHRPGALIEAAGSFKAALEVPVIAFGRIEPDEAERALVAGKADFIAMGRKLIADPALPLKLLRGRPETIRPCIYQYRCIGNLYVRGHISCVVNPEAGHEDRAGPDAGKADSRRLCVLISGAGPAGLEAARRLTGRHQVILADRESAPGGKLVIAARHNRDLAPLLAWLVEETLSEGAELMLDTEVNAELIQRVRPDVVIGATGARWVLPDLPGGNLPSVCTLDGRDWSLFDPRGADVAILGGSSPALHVAASLRARGGRVQVVEAGGVLAPELGVTGRNRLVHDLETAGVSFHLSSIPVRIGEGTVDLRSSSGEAEIPADIVIAAECLRPNPLPWLVRTTQLEGEGEVWRPATWSIGECAGRQFIEGAMLSAASAARKVHELARN